MPSAALTSHEIDLRDLCRRRPELIEARSGRATGLRLLAFVASGGMSSVFLAELDPARRSVDLSAATPRQIAVKILQPSTWWQFERLNQDPSQIFHREVVALSRIMERTPPTEYVVGYYGSGYADIQTPRGPMCLPWLAIEYLGGSADGVSLGDRVERARPDGIDPVRALRLVRGIVSGVSILHDEGILHRDLKPENVLVAGPIDDETPKLADCGIARVDGMLGTVAGMTPSYGAPEQALPSHGARNPLVGPWTDVHALAAVIWYVLTGEDWCRSDTDPAWHGGQRRSLRTARSASAFLLGQPALVQELDAVLARGAAPRLPDEAWGRPTSTEYRRTVEALAPSMLTGQERYASVEAFAADLMPLLETHARTWTTRAAHDGRAATAFRATQPVQDTSGAGEVGATVRLVPPLVETPPDARACAVFQPDGRFLLRLGDRLDYVIDDKPHRVKVPPEHVADVGEARWLLRGPGGGFALVGSHHVVVVRGGRFARLPPRVRRSGGEVGPIVAVIDDGRVFGVVTEETDDGDGGPELWRSSDGSGWDEPMVLPLGGDIAAVAQGPFGLLVVGARRNKARAMFVGFDDHPLLLLKGVSERTPLVACVCSAGRDAWGAGEGFVLHLERSGAHEEPVEVTDRPVAMGLDRVGTPWLLTERHVLRRHVRSHSASWRVYHHAPAPAAPFVAMGFASTGVRVVDARGGGVHVVPRDVQSWRPEPPP